LPPSPSSTATTRWCARRARIAQGDLGPLHLIHGSYLQDWLLDPASNNWRVDPALGGTSRVFADIGSHWCDLVEWVSGERFTEVNAAFSTVIAERSAVTGQSFSTPAAPARRRRSRARTWQRRCSGPAPARWRR
jgi:predicted dehydrogenase